MISTVTIMSHPEMAGYLRTSCLLASHAFFLRRSIGKMAVDATLYVSLFDLTESRIILARPPHEASDLVLDI